MTSFAVPVSFSILWRVCTYTPGIRVGHPFIGGIDRRLLQGIVSDNLQGDRQSQSVGADHPGTVVSVIPGDRRHNHAGDDRRARSPSE